jgi:hypothetical protein
MKYSNAISEVDAEDKVGGVLSVFKRKNDEGLVTTKNMTPDEVAEVISNQLIDTIKAQMAEGKRRYEEQHKLSK